MKSPVTHPPFTVHLNSAFLRGNHHTRIIHAICCLLYAHTLAHTRTVKCQLASTPGKHPHTKRSERLQDPIFCKKEADQLVQPGVRSRSRQSAGNKTRKISSVHDTYLSADTATAAGAAAALSAAAVVEREVRFLLLAGSASVGQSRGPKIVRCFQNKT